jgi:hypothetical protein
MQGPLAQEWLIENPLKAANNPSLGFIDQDKKHIAYILLTQQGSQPLAYPKPSCEGLLLHH